MTNTNKKYAVFACAIHSSIMAYSFYAPVIAAAWQRVGYNVIVLFIGDFRVQNVISSRLNLTHEILRQIGAIVLYIQCPASYDIKISQLIRVFIGFLPDNIVNDEDSLITTDSDLIPIDKNQYKHESDTAGFLINSYCCGNFTRRGKQYRMMAMSHICLKKKQWRALFMESVQRKELVSLNHSLNLLSDQAPFSFETIDLYAKHEFKDVYTQNMTKGDSAWYMDQILCSMLLTDYRENHPDLILIERNLTQRLDRDWGIASWNRSDFEKFGDAHLPHDKIFISYYWKIVNKLFAYLFTDSELKLFDSYYEKYKIIGNKLS